MKKTRKRLWSFVLTLTMLLSLMPTMSLTASAAETKEPPTWLSCTFKGKSVEWLDNWLKNNGYGGISGGVDGAVAGTDYVTAGACEFKFYNTSDNACRWECLTHTVDYTGGSHTDYEPGDVHLAVGVGHSGGYCQYCKWSNHTHDLEWKYDDSKHWKGCKNNGCSYKESEASHSYNSSGVCTCGRVLHMMLLWHWQRVIV